MTKLQFFFRVLRTGSVIKQNKQGGKRKALISSVRKKF